MVQNPDGSIYFTYNKNNSSTEGLEKSFLSKLNANGIVDTSFGINGELQLPYFNNDSQLKKQADGKLVILSSSDSGPVILRILPMGQFDATFGTNGISSAVPPLGIDENEGSYGIILQNDKIIVHGIDYSSEPSFQHKIYRLDTTGALDNTFGNSGSISTQGTKSNGSFVLIDNQFNLVCLTASGMIEKFNPSGQPLTSFGNNGTLQATTYNLSGANKVIMDSNNHILYSNLVGKINRIKPDGTLDSSFNFNPVGLLPFSVMIFSIVEKDGYYYIGGMSEGSNVRYFISKLNQSGSIDPNFNYYSETNPDLGLINDMTVNHNSIIADGSNHIVKYLLNTTTLSSMDTKRMNNEIFLENPVKQNLIYQSKEQVSTIEIYSMDGKILKTIKDNRTNVSELIKGTYLAKITLENKKVIIKKFIKD